VFLSLAVAVDCARFAPRLHNTAVTISILPDRTALPGFSLAISVDVSGHMARLNHPAIAVGILAYVAAAAARHGRLLLRVGLSRIAVGHDGPPCWVDPINPSQATMFRCAAAVVFRLRTC
jgi:hypothetical protein